MINYNLQSWVLSVNFSKSSSPGFNAPAGKRKPQPGFIGSTLPDVTNLHGGILLLPKVNFYYWPCEPRCDQSLYFLTLVPSPMADSLLNLMAV
jgi:hypothetical protein